MNLLILARDTQDRPRFLLSGPRDERGLWNVILASLLGLFSAGGSGDRGVTRSHHRAGCRRRLPAQNQDFVLTRV
jgi:hypothetical protein